MAAESTPVVVPTLTRQGRTATVTFDADLLESMGLEAGAPLTVVRRGPELVVQAAAKADDRSATFDRVMRETAAENAELFRRLAK